MESFKKWMDRVVGKRPDITADWSTTNAETLVPVKNTRKSEETSVAAFHLMIATMCIEYMKRMSSIQFADNSEKKSALEKLGLTNSKTYKDIVALDDMYKEVELLNYLKPIFPNSMFMKLEDFKALCRKYGLVCGTLDEFKGEVPDKNLKEIDAALEIVSNGEYNISQYFEHEVYTFKKITVIEGKGTNYRNQIEKMKDDLSHFHFRKCSLGDIMKLYGSRQIRDRHLFGLDISGIDVDHTFLHPKQMLIAASPDLMSKIQISYEEIPAPKPMIDDDPIVFQILSHDIVMIHSKWGDGSNDPMFDERKL